MDERDTALWWAKCRSGGPQRVPSGSAAPAGLRRLVEADAHAVWLLPNIPESAGPAVLEEYGLPGLPVVDAVRAMRVLSACVRCCWPNPGADIWPGISAPLTQIAAVFARLSPGLDARSRHSVLLGHIRRLDRTGWLLYDEPAEILQLGPRVALWSSLDMSTLRELWRTVPQPGPVADRDGPR